MSEFVPNFDKGTKSSLIWFSFGDIAQLVEQMTFNHWVQGSSPCVPTKIHRRFGGIFIILIFYKKFDIILSMNDGLNVRFFITPRTICLGLFLTQKE